MLFFQWALFCHLHLEKLFQIFANFNLTLSAGLSSLPRSPTWLILQHMIDWNHHSRLLQVSMNLFRCLVSYFFTFRTNLQIFLLLHFKVAYQQHIIPAFQLLDKIMSCWNRHAIISGNYPVVFSIVMSLSRLILLESILGLINNSALKTVQLKRWTEITRLSFFFFI